MRVVNTDNHGSDYPDEWFCSEPISEDDAKLLRDALNLGLDDHSSRYHKIVPDSYILQPGFEP
jgi:hypothetical protein